jgi:hypothetical protein
VSGAVPDALFKANHLFGAELSFTNVKRAEQSGNE